MFRPTVQRLVAACLFLPFVAQTQSVMAQSVMAQSVTDQDLMEKAVAHHPGADQWSIYGNGQAHNLVKDAGVPGGYAFTVNVTSAGGNPWDVESGVVNDTPIHKGDVILMAFWARAVTPPPGADTINIVARAQQVTAPYTEIGTANLTISSAWKLYYATGTATMDYDKGQAGAGLQLATAQQTIALGPVFMLDFGPGYDLAKLPKN